MHQRLFYNVTLFGLLFVQICKHWLQKHHSEYLDCPGNILSYCIGKIYFYLFSAIDEDGIHDFNSDVLETLIKFYIMEPTVDEGDIDNKVEYLTNLHSPEVLVAQISFSVFVGC